MKKKTVTTVTAAILAASMLLGLAACGGGSTPSETQAAGGGDGAAKEEAAASENAFGIEGLGSQAEGLTAEEGAEIEICYWAGSTSDEAAWNAILEKLQADHPEIKLKLQTYPSSDFRDMLDTRIAGNDWPDVIRYTYQRLGKFKQAEVMLDLSPYITEENVADFADAFRSGCTYQGKLVALPHHTDTVALFYNKRMFEEQGIRIPTGPDDAYTWDELKDILRKLKEAYNLTYAASGIWDNGSGYRYLPFVYANGGTLLNEDQTEATVNTPEFLEAIQFYDDLRAEDLIANVGFTAPTQANSLFVAEQIAVDFAGSWHCSYMEENMAGNWGMTYMPLKDGKTGSDMGGNGIWAYAGTKYPKAAAIVCEYITNAEGMKIFCEAGNFIPVRKSLIESGLDYKNFPEEMALLNEIVLTIDPKMAADETSVPFLRINEAFCEEMDPLAVNRSATPEQVVENLQNRVTEILAEQ